MHYGGIQKEESDYYKFNLATSFDSILNDINKSKGNIEEENLNQNKINNDIDYNKFNNIIYYDPNINFSSNINQDIDDFEKVIPGAFILCTNMDSFKIIRAQILLQIKKERLAFNLITTGSQCDNVMRFLDEDPNFKSCIKNVLVYCPDIQNWLHLKNKYELVYDVASSKDRVIHFIKNFSSEVIKPYEITKVITLNDYLEKYKERHIKISQLYGDFSVDKEYIIFDELNKYFKYFKYTNFNSFEEVAYFTARLMYSLNRYAKQEGKYHNLNINVFRGAKMSYLDILQYERAKGKIIVLSSFTSTSQNEILAQKWSGRKDSKALFKTNLKFSVIFIIKNNFKENWISNGIKIESIYEEDILYLPFSFYYVRDVQIDLKNYMADIYLDTIGKKEILEEKIKIGKEIKYNEKERIMEVK